MSGLVSATSRATTSSLSAPLFHYGLGITLSQTRDILDSHLHTTVTAGGLMDAWARMAEALRPWNEQIAEQLRSTACLHADETGWTSASSVEPRVDGLR